MRTIIAIILMVFSALQVASQTPLYRNFNIKDGLPSNETHCIFPDSRGFIWIGTDNGITCYDGTNFRKYEISDISFNKTVFHITESADGTIWFSTYKSGIYYIKDNKLNEHPLNNEIIHLTQGRIINELIIGEGIIYFSTNGRHNTYFTIKDNKLSEVDYEYNKEDHISFKVINGKVLHNSTHLARAEDMSDEMITNYKIEGNLNSFSFKTSPFSYYEHAITIVNSSILVTKHNLLKTKEYGETFELLEIKKDYKVNQYTLPARPIFTYYDKEKNYILLGTHDSGIILIDSLRRISTFLPSFSVSSIVKDNMGNLWIGTLKNGILLINDLSIQKLSNNIYTSIAAIKPYIITASKSIFEPILFKNELRMPEHFIYISESGGVLAANTNEKTLISWDTGKSFKPIKHLIKMPNNFVNNLIGVSKIISYDSGVIYISRSNICWGKVNNTVIDRYLVRDHKWEDLYTDGYLINDTLWLASNKGLLKKSVSGNYFSPPLKTKIEQPIACITAINDKLIIASDNLYWFNPYTGELKILFPSIDNFAITKIIHDPEVNGLWISSKTGILFYDLKSNQIRGIPELSRNNIDKVYDINLINNDLYIASEQGLLRFNTKNKNTQDKTKVLINIPKQFSSDSLSKKVKVYSNTNSLVFTYLGINYASNAPINYKYCLTGFNADTIETINNEIQYTNLPAGDYTFSVWASIDNINWTKQPASYSFTILPHYTETWWFISLTVLAALLVISSIFLLIIRNLKRRNEIQKELLLLEQKALRAQMNPHFTFNALNSIQYFITDNNKRAATNFLSKFAKLVRNILNNSRSNTISLADEISTLTTYLELEQMRFNGKIAVNMHVGDNLVPDSIFIPSMILQPFLENAIWHGIMPKEDGIGKLDISFELIDSTLICKIKDNGIGREKSAELKKKTRNDHKSTGLKNIEDRIAVLNHIHPQSKISITIVDIDNEDDTGTEVIIIFELGKEYND